jgi:hypothetical protein
MRYRTYILFFALVLIAQMSLIASVQAADFAECAQDIANKDFIAKQAFQTELRDMIVAPRQDFKELANLNMDLQIALAEARKTVIAYLLEHEPARLSTTGGLSKFSNFDWSEKDQEKFVQANKAHAQLAEKVEKLKKANNSHPDWGKMRGYMRGVLSKKPGFEKLMSNFFADQKKLGDLLGKCLN